MKGGEEKEEIAGREHGGRSQNN